MILGHDLSFWVSVIGATLIKLFTSPYSSFTRAILTVFAAMFAAYVFTEPMIHWLSLDAATYTTPMAALLALTGEGLMRVVMGMADNPIRAIELYNAWRYGGKSDDDSPSA